MIQRLMNWLKYIFFVSKVNKTEDERKEIANILFNRLYKNTRLDNDKEFIEWEKTDKNETVCSYCGISYEEMVSFYDHVKSDRDNRGKSWEIDRKDTRMKTFLKTKDERNNFIAWAKKNYYGH